MNKCFLKVAALLGALSVGLGAFGAHGLKKLVDAPTLAIFETGVRYQFYHVFAIALVAMLLQWLPNKLVRLAGYFFIVGIILFSGSLYLMTAFRAGGNDSFNWLGAITPFGGVSFIAGWLLLFAGLMRK